MSENKTEMKMVEIDASNNVNISKLIEGLGASDAPRRYYSNTKDPITRK
jgi:hypothetical protein